jgi:hypothetical protein
VTATDVHVISTDGELLWSWNYSRSSRFLNPGSYSGWPLAISPDCDRVAMGGDPGYKYVWVAGRDEEPRFIQTIGTPRVVAFALNDNDIAITTGAARGYLLSRTLETRWTGPLREFPVRWPEQVVSDRARASFAQFTRDSVDALLSIWAWGGQDSVSLDGQWRAYAAPPWANSDGWQMLHFYGPEGHAFHGRWESFKSAARPRWSKAIGCLNAEVTPDGEFVVATGDPRQPQNALGGRPQTEIECLKEGVLTTFVFDRTGATVMRLPATSDVTTEGFAEAFKAKTGRTLPSQFQPTPVSFSRRVCHRRSGARADVLHRT